MAEKTINNPSLLPSDLSFELSGNTITAISGHPIAGSGGGTVSDLVYYPVFDNSNGNVTFHLGTSAHGPEPGGAWHISGADGVDGVSPTVSTSVIEGGNRVTFTYGEGSSTYIDVMSGTPGTSGTAGFSPTVTASEISPTTQHPQGGTSVTITDSAGVHQFDVWNGLNGEGATVNLLEGTGIQITENGTDYTIGVSANYSAMAVTWVQDQHYLTDIPNTYALKTDVEAASANAYNKAVAQIPSVTNFITKDADNLTYYYKKTETSSTSEITNALSTKLDSTVAEQTYQTKADMTNYLTTSDASTIYQPKGNYATTSDISDMATQTWVGQQGFLKNTDLTDYATKTYTNEASANALSEAKTWVGQEGYLKTVSVTANGSIEGAGTTNNPLSLKTSAEQALAAVDGKVSKPTASQQQGVYVVWDKGPTQNWTDFYVAANSWANTFLFDSESPIVNGINGLSVGLVPGEFFDVYEVGIDTADMAANKQYAFTTTGWEEVDDYLPTAGGTVSGQVVLSATTGTFEQSYLKCINNTNVGNAIFGLGSYGGAVIKTVDGNNNSVQVNVNAGSDNSQLINVKTNNGNTNVGYLIPAMVEQAGWTPSTDDKILHIVLES